MKAGTDRASELIEGIKRERKALISPEGIVLDVQIAGHGERLTAFLLDMTFILATLTFLFALLLVLELSYDKYSGAYVGETIIMFAVFIVRNMYFLHFELAWQGMTPGKKICGLRVINREGGELKPSAIIARNLAREVEFFLPLGLYLGLNEDLGAWTQLASLGWTLTLTVVPFFNREHLRAGDIIGGTQVISMPKRALLNDLTEQPRLLLPKNSATPRKNYVFTFEQLAIYGNLELQVLEEILRRPANEENDSLLSEVCGKICRKIGWEESVPQNDIRRFLNDFYAALRAELERGQLFGRIRADKTAAPGRKIQP